MIQWWQILLLTLYSAYQILDELTIVSSAGSPVFAGFISGIIMGDVQTGLWIGGSLQLMVLGVGTFGGASRIDATSGAVIAIAFSVAQGIEPELAISTIAVPVAALLVYTDILGRFSTTFFAHRIDRHVENFNYRGIERDYLMGAVPWALSRALPVFLAVSLGGGAVDTVVKFIDHYEWLANGLTLAGKMLPGLGFAILLHYLPVKRNLHYLALGFGLTAMLTTIYTNLQVAGGALAGVAKDFNAAPFKGLPMIGIAIIGLALATLHYKNGQQAPVAEQKTGVSESGEIEDDEI
ncbi:PTS mannose/fructose/sorbose/N-acetylgalactosamine transporter subunit IIC [Streptococcus equi subsp. zooepidemicus]|uniref:Sugar phosphotransferase system (PTS), sorbose-specific family, IIC component n=1 Tax=Streptococcus equi subsp. zooepidemicus (strain H70) TaxID=553483 RepID=C0MHB7_STRS7|nr:PTS mannose/fructose/sorbose/N-acetylgalactosamine transporter subunit IIC [Streptococcus equi]MCD3398720.1 PTS mannose/fructose/sorbose/N-acetylgalactosamine transporter subunit IIC [Streptococcus equi subsp. zooepidemicus]MCD3450926.1 PTS mannose/fructose/sorbose/N-acetylgalactosamine transporter subunit IIC [Streptococcus equi subsp. zooepidemicus]MCD3466158.1 PTS mannose/fructose/sorbose/N-acetylgalactosamine transporter subunit IIC [Streptococcus equi subsp. zooepidemicus]CAW99684.1 sug